MLTVNHVRELSVAKGFLSFCDFVIGFGGGVVWCFGFFLMVRIAGRLCFDSSEKLSLNQIVYKVWATAAYFPSHCMS